MDQINDWPREAAANLSGGFTRTESINMLTDKGLAEEVAVEIIDELILQSRNKGFKRLGLGALFFAGAFFMATFLNYFPISEGIKPVFVLGIVAFGDGIRRLGSLWLVTRT